MTALVFEKNQRSREMITRFLVSLGYQSVLAVQEDQQFRDLVTQLQGAINLILIPDASVSKTENIESLGSSLGHEGLIDFLACQNDLSLTPIVILLEHPPRRKDRHLGFHPRIDNGMSKPFSLQQFRYVVDQAYAHRALKRDTIVILSSTLLDPKKIQEGLETFHWKYMDVVHQPHELEVHIKKYSSSIGAILLDPEACDHHVANWCRRFKKTRFGLMTPLVFLSRDPSSVYDFRLTCDLFANHPDQLQPISALYPLGLLPNSYLSWARLLSVISQRTLNFWKAKKIIPQTRQAEKNGNAKLARRLLQRAMNCEAQRWEFLELAGTQSEKHGKPHQAIHYFKTALSYNPCTPFPYLKLAQLLQDAKERQAFLELGQRYCPSHPQLLALLKKNQDKKDLLQ